MKEQSYGGVGGFACYDKQGHRMSEANPVMFTQRSMKLKDYL